MRDFPVMKLHPTGQAYLRYEGKVLYFGKFGTAKAAEKYDRWKAGKLGLRVSGKRAARGMR